MGGTAGTPGTGGSAHTDTSTGNNTGYGTGSGKEVTHHAPGLPGAGIATGPTSAQGFDTGSGSYGAGSEATTNVAPYGNTGAGANVKPASNTSHNSAHTPNTSSHSHHHGHGPGAVTNTGTTYSAPTGSAGGGTGAGPGTAYDAGSGSAVSGSGPAFTGNTVQDPSTHAHSGSTANLGSPADGTATPGYTATGHPNFGTGSSNTGECHRLPDAMGGVWHS